MVDVALSAGQLLLALVLVVLNGFFVAAEFAYVRVRSSAVEQFVKEGRSGADLLQNAMDNLDDYLAVTQLGITISSLGLGWVGEPAVADLIEPVLGSFLPSSAVHLVAFAVGFSVITFLHVVFGELAPKTIAIAQAERVALLVAAPMEAFYYLFLPGIVVFNGTANFFTRLIGVPPASETDETLSEEEILTVLTRSGREGNIGMEEVEMIERVFELDDRSAREIMIPRPDAVTVSPTDSLADLRSLVVDAGHTRYPVVEAGDDDEIVGFVDVKDILRASEAADPDAASVTAGDLAREMPVVPETAHVTDLLEQFQHEQRQMAGVIDEWGSFEGIVTVEDILEEVVGDIRDEFDHLEPEPTIDRREDGTYVVDGGVTLTRVADALDVAFDGEDVDTVGGLVLDRLGRAPTIGDQVDVRDHRVEVERVDGARVSRVLVRPAESENEPAE